MSAAYRARIDRFLKDNDDTILGQLASAGANQGNATLADQIRAWQATIHLLRSEFQALLTEYPACATWCVLLEFEIPRRARRPDIVIIAHNLIFIIECKIGSQTFESADRWQTKRYALDLRDFHEGSIGRIVIPLLWAPASDCTPITTNNVLCIGREGLAAAIRDTWNRLGQSLEKAIDPKEWNAARYRPTPSIIEAASTLFGGHQVANISHSFSTNLSTTTDFLIHAVEQARRDGLRTICFVTGIPGAGKTLTGLAAVHDPAIRAGGAPAAIFLSGNGPLVKIVREALVRGEQSRGVARELAKHRVSTFIDNVHRFIKAYGVDGDSAEESYENVIVFDEAQRAWDAHQMSRKNRVHKSESEIVLEIMERKEEWCVIIALVGGGQEINTGEAGLEEWGRALSRRSAHWTVYASPEVLVGGETVAGHRLFSDGVGASLTVHAERALNLAVNTRSHRARRLGEWVNRFVSDEHDGDELAIREGIGSEFPVYFTRGLEHAKAWLHAHADPSERFGLLASSGALRLRASGIEVSSGFRGGYPYECWFLNERGNSLSSHQLEVAATEFECQGLELDWTCVCWGGDFTPDVEHSLRWSFRRFAGSRWQAVNVASMKQFIRNKYRVLLTRARQGMIVWVPRGDTSDLSRDITRYDAVADRLRRAGVAEIE